MILDPKPQRLISKGPKGMADDFATPMQDPTQSPSFAQEILEQLQGAELRKLNLMDLGLNRRRMNSGMDQ